MISRRNILIVVSILILLGLAFNNYQSNTRSLDENNNVETNV
jgi:hypothetical protein